MNRSNKKVVIEEAKYQEQTNDYINNPKKTAVESRQYETIHEEEQVSPDKPNNLTHYIK